MLRRAERRAPSASFQRDDVLNAAREADVNFDHIVLGFLLHELDQATRIELLKLARARTIEGGSIAILEWANPTGRIASRVWRTVVRAIEPAIALDVLDGAVVAAIDAAGLKIFSSAATANGRAQIIVAVR